MQYLAQKNRVDTIVLFMFNSQQAENKYHCNKIEHRLRLEACKDVFNRMNNEGISYAVIKGAYLDKIAYGDYGLRSSNDIDILIDKNNYSKVYKILIQEGFICGYIDRDGVHEYSRELRLYNLMYTHQSATFVKQVVYEEIVYQIKVDINYSISWGEDPAAILMTPIILKNTQIACYAGINYNILIPEYFLMQLCLHSYRDMNSLVLIYKKKHILRLLCDIYYYIVRNSSILNIVYFCSIVQKYGYEKQIYSILISVQHAFGRESWIDNAIDCLGINNDTLVDCYGISPDEIKKWEIDFWDRFTCDNLFEAIRSQLTDKDWKKLNSIINHM